MSYIVTKTNKGIDYQYQYRCEWVDGKPKSIYEAYLGRADKLGSRSKGKLGSRLISWIRRKKWRRSQ